MSGEWLTVGRTNELALIEESLTAAPARPIVIAGPPGVGKSRLVDEALRIAATAGLAARQIRATNATRALPLGAFSSVLPALEFEAFRGRVGLIREAADALVTRVETRRIVLGIDDAHLLDDLSAALVHHLVATDGAHVVASVRSGEPAPDAIVGLWKDGEGARLEVDALTAEETAALLEVMLGGPADGGTHQWVWATTQGNPLYLRELVLGARRHGTLVERDGIWRGSGSVSAAPGLLELIEDRLRVVAAKEREALEVLAIAEPIELDQLALIIDVGVLDRPERQGLVDIHDQDGTKVVALTHPLYGEVLRAQASTAATQAAKRRLAAMLERQADRGGEDLLRLTRWRLESGAAQPPDELLTSARHALAMFDFGLAESCARAACRAGGGVPARCELAAALIGLGRFAEADHELDEAERMSTGDAERVPAAVARAENLYWHLARPREAMATIEAAEQASTGGGARRALSATRATLLLFEGASERSVALARELLDGAAVDDPAAWQAAMTAGWGEACLGRLESSIETLERFLALAADHPSAAPPLAVFWLRTARISVLSFLGRFAEAMSAGRDAYEDAAEAQSGIGRTMHAFALGWCARLQGTPEPAVRWLREAVGQLREVDLFRHLSSALGELAQAEALLGNAGAAERALADAERAQVPGFRMDTWAVGLGRAWAAAVRGEETAARAHALRTAEETAALGQWFLEAQVRHDALRLGAPGQAEPLALLAERVDGPLVACFADHAAALERGDPGALTEVGEAFAALDAWLLAAEAYAGASQAFESQGRDASARSAAARAEALGARCPGARSPALAALRAPALSPREREVASLAARGLSNREIADRLVVSVRTVENHLHSAYRTLGVTGRDELAVPLGIE